MPGKVKTSRATAAKAVESYVHICIPRDPNTGILHAPTLHDTDADAQSSAAQLMQRGLKVWIAKVKEP